MTGAVAPTGPLVLRAGVEIVPVGSFPKEIREKFGGAESDYVLSDLAARLSSKRIDAESAEFLRQFAAPRRIVDAVVAHGSRRSREPSDVLRELYPLLALLLDNDMLVEPDAPPPRPPGPAYEAGREVHGFRIVECVAELAETEVYRARAADGRDVALKTLRPGAADFVRRSLRRELGILEHLARERPGSAPAPIDARWEQPDPFLAMEWIDGRTLWQVMLASDVPLRARARMAIEVGRAYARIHEAGVLHGDVHPRNLIVARGGVRIVDFGAARLAGSSSLEQRLGVVPYYEPEVARALLAGEDPPLPTSAGEQYTVAVTLYFIVTGNDCLVLSLEAEAALRQIAELPPRPFADAGLRWPALESVLRRALEKDPERRHGSFLRFAEAFEAALVTEPDRARRVRGSRAADVPRFRDQELLERTAARLVDRYGLLAESTRHGLSQGPTASLYRGAAGVAYALFRQATLRDDAESLAAADVWIARALEQNDSALAYSDGLADSAQEIGPFALFHSESGVQLVRALVRHAGEDGIESAEAIEAFTRAAQTFVSSAAAAPAELGRFALDATQGAASLLFGASLLYPLCAGGDTKDREALYAVARSLRGHVEHELDVSSRSRSASGPKFLGFAHGRSGALSALLRWAEVSGDAVSAVLDAELEALALCSRRREGDGDLAGGEPGSLAWPLEWDAPDGPAWTGWCHGSAGHLLTWAAAARACAREDYRALAIGAGADIWRRRGSSEHSLCCGAAGEALALFELGRLTQDDRWFERGRELIATAARSIDALADSQGLFRGDVGVALAALEALDPAASVWPIVRSPG